MEWKYAPGFPSDKAPLNRIAIPSIFNRARQIPLCVIFGREIWSLTIRLDRERGAAARAPAISIRSLSHFLIRMVPPTSSAPPT